ncbi:MAG: type II toxin-antitoxin system ParD family antitoxin [Candidatus Nitrotoga sp.]
MNIVFPLVDESYIKAKIDDGFYSNATELVRDAVRRLREFDDSKYIRLMAAIEVGDQAAREGRTQPYTSELLEQIEQTSRQFAADGRKPNSDVCP